MKKQASFHLPRTGADRTSYRLISDRFIRQRQCAGRPALAVEPEALTLLAAEAFSDLGFYLRPTFLSRLRSICGNPRASANDRFVASALLENAAISAEGVLPLCQDTGTAQIIGYKGHRVMSDGADEAALAAGIRKAYRSRNFRYSQMSAPSMFEETNTKTNLPAQIDLQAAEGLEYTFYFMAKGGGSANKTALFQESKALLEEKTLASFLAEKIRALGVAACPPYRLAIVIGGLSPDMTLKTVKFAAAGFLDGMPKRGGRTGAPYRDMEWEQRVMDIAAGTGLGAQFGGRYLAHEVRVIRLPRHAGSCPVGIGVSCSADRNCRGKITRDGLFLEDLERHPSRFLKGIRSAKAGPETEIDLNRPISEIVCDLSALPVGALVRLSGPLVVARDIAHARLWRRFCETGRIPDYFKQHPIYYAGPAKTPKGMASGSFGPTTAQRMDGYMPAFMQAGASLITMGKGNRSAQIIEACRSYGGFFLGTIGGAAALIAKKHICESEVIDFPELGMEAVRRIVVEDLPAFVIYDDKGGDLYK